MARDDLPRGPKATHILGLSLRLVGTKKSGNKDNHFGTVGVYVSLLDLVMVQGGVQSAPGRHAPRETPSAHG